MMDWRRLWNAHLAFSKHDGEWKESSTIMEVVYDEDDLYLHDDHARWHILFNVN